MTCSCCASRPLERGRRELRATTSDQFHVSTGLLGSSCGHLRGALCCAHRALAAESAQCFRRITVLRCGSILQHWHQSDLRLVQRQTCSWITSQAVLRTRSLTIICPGAATGKQGDGHFDMSFHGGGMHGNVEARCSRFCVTTPLPEPGQHNNCCGENMSFRGILISNNSLT